MGKTQAQTDENGLPNILIFSFREKGGKNQKCPNERCCLIL